MYPVNETECFSTGLEQLALVYDKAKIFYKFGYKYQAYDPEHLALVIGLLQEGKDIDGSCQHKEIVASNTALARAWKEAVKDAIPETTYNEMLSEKYYLGRIGFKTAPWRSKIRIEEDKSNDLITIKGIIKEKIPVTAYIIWGYSHQKFPFSLFYDIKDLPFLMNLTNKNIEYIPFWYTIGMKIPKMR